MRIVQNAELTSCPNTVRFCDTFDVSVMVDKTEEGEEYTLGDPGDWETPSSTVSGPFNSLRSLEDAVRQVWVSLRVEPEFQVGDTVYYGDTPLEIVERGQREAFKVGGKEAAFWAHRSFLSKSNPFSE